MANEKKTIEDYIQEQRQSPTYTPEQFSLPAILMMLYEIKEENLQDAFFQRPFEWRKLVQLLAAYQEKLPPGVLLDMARLPYPELLIAKEDFLRRKFYGEKEEMEQKAENMNAAYLLKSIEIASDQVKYQLGENKRFTGYLIKSMEEKDGEIAGLKKENRQLAGELGKRKVENQAKTSRAAAVPPSPEKILRETEHPREWRKGTRPHIRKEKLKGFFSRKEKEEAKDDAERILDIICGNDFNEGQLQEVVGGYEQGLSVEEILRYAKVGNPETKMRKIREILQKRNAGSLAPQLNTMPADGQETTVTGRYKEAMPEMGGLEEIKEDAQGVYTFTPEEEDAQKAYTLHEK